jgi:hypothetical protein
VKFIDPLREAFTNAWPAMRKWLTPVGILLIAALRNCSPAGHMLSKWFQKAFAVL